MCVVVQHHLGKGTRCAPPLHPPGLGSYWASNPSRASGTYHRSITRRAWRRPSPPAPNHGSSELSRSPEPHSQGAFGAPCTHRLGRRSCPQGPRPFHGGQPCADWMCVSVSTLNPVMGLSRPLNPRAGLGDMTSPPAPNQAQTECPFDPQSGKQLLLPPIPIHG